MNKILFSVIIPTYNRPEKLLDVVDQLFLQSFQDWELIIVDDSKVSEQESIDALNDKRLKYFHRGQKLGVSSARNFGAARANGTYLAFIDDDDRVAVDWLLDFSKLIEQNNGPDVLTCAMERVGRKSDKNSIVYPSAALGTLVIPGAFILSKSIFEAIGGYDERLNFGENTELFFRVKKQRPKHVYTKSVNFYYHQSLDGLSQNLENKIATNKIFLSKHKALFESNKKMKILCLSVLGVCLLRLKKFDEARGYLWECYKLNPTNIKSFFRVLVSFAPIVSKRIYTK